MYFNGVVLPNVMSLKIGDIAPDFKLKNANKKVGDRTVSINDSVLANGLVVVFECNHCPYVVASIERMNSLADYCKLNKIGFVGINSNDASVYPTDSFEHMEKRAEKGMPYSYLFDETQEIAKAYAAQRTPEFFLFDSKMCLVYKGRMDDSPKNPSDVTKTELKDAIDSLLSGNLPEVQITESIGCSVKWK